MATTIAPPGYQTKHRANGSRATRESQPWHREAVATVRRLIEWRLNREASKPKDKQRHVADRELHRLVSDHWYRSGPKSYVVTEKNRKPGQRLGHRVGGVRQLTKREVQRVIDAYRDELWPDGQPAEWDDSPPDARATVAP